MAHKLAGLLPGPASLVQKNDKCYLESIHVTHDDPVNNAHFVLYSDVEDKNDQRCASQSLHMIIDMVENIGKSTGLIFKWPKAHLKAVKDRPLPANGGLVAQRLPVAAYNKSPDSQAPIYYTQNYQASREATIYEPPYNTSVTETEFPPLQSQLYADFAGATGVPDNATITLESRADSEQITNWIYRKPSTFTLVGS